MTVIQNNEPTAGVAKVLAQRAFGREDFDEATKWYEEAISLTEAPEGKGELQMDIAKLNLAKGDKPGARAAAMKAIEYHSLVDKEAYKFIGNLYMGSFNDCKQEKSQVQDRAVFMAAYDAFQKAGDSQGMRQAKAQFPTKSNVFEANMEEGQNISVGCWIQRGTKIRARASE